jgi:hypothetical protein
MGRLETGTDVVERLIAAYGIEADIYQSLLALVRKQGQLLEEDRDVERCSALFDRKEELLTSITNIERDIEPVKRAWWDADVEGATRERLNALLDAILATIEGIMEQEQLNEQLLLQCQREVEAELGHIQRGYEMHRTQTDDLQPMPRFMDIHH